MFEVFTPEVIIFLAVVETILGLHLAKKEQNRIYIVLTILFLIMCGVGLIGYYVCTS